ncbi:MAG TPA: DUF6519 domain-containing protein [Steroidobacter sp.]
MKADFTRSTYRQDKHYSSVRLQQGRVQLDADWNESADIVAHRIETETLDTVGQSGGPMTAAGFALATDVAVLPASQQSVATSLLPLDPGDFIISAGRYYVEGVLCENERPVTFGQQPDPPANGFAATAGTYLAFLDVWSHHVTALEDPDIREVALGGPDTATRTKTVWQVRLIEVDPAELAATTGLPASISERSTGKLSARAMPGVTQTDACLIQPGAGYRRTENQLYRVEIHGRGPLGGATYKWSRDNASLVIRWLGQSGNTLTVASVRNDGSLGLEPGDCLELTDTEHELGGEPGQLVTLVAVAGQTLTVQPNSASDVIDFTQYRTQPKVRRWNGIGIVAASAVNDGYIELEAGVEVKFDAGKYASGDYWQIPARTATGGILWPFAKSQPPLGIKHRYCRLAVMEFDGAQFTAIHDHRCRYPAATELTSMFYLGGDGQESAPGQPVPQPLLVGVANGQWPVAGANVRFTITAGSGTLQGSQTPVTVTTDAAGIASCAWTLGAATANQQVEAVLLDAAGEARHLPVRFNASFSNDARDAGIHVQKILFADQSLFANDSDVQAATFAAGIQLICDADVAPHSVDRASCYATVEIPFPASVDDKTLWGAALLGYQPLVLAGTISVQGATIHWTPAPSVNTWLENRLFEYLRRNKLATRVLARFTLHGDFIWQSGKPEIALDGDVFGMPVSGTERTALRLPSGDGRRGGDLRLWFWLIETSAVSISILPNVATATVGSTLQLTVNVSGTTNRAAELSVDGVVNGNATVGTLKRLARGGWSYKAPLKVSRVMRVTISAKSLADPTQVATAVVTITQ